MYVFTYISMQVHMYILQNFIRWLYEIIYFHNSINLVWCLLDYETVQTCFKSSFSLARLLEISLNKATIPSDWKKSHSGSYLQRSRSIGSDKQLTHYLNLSGLQANGTHNSRVFKASLG